MTSPRSTGPEKRLEMVSKLLNKKSKPSTRTFPCFSEQLHCVQPKDIPSLLQTGVAVYSSEGLELPLKDASALPPITPQQPLESMNKPQSSFLTLNEHVLRASLKTWFYPNERSKWPKLSKTSKTGSLRTKAKRWELISRVTSIILLASVFLIPRRLGLLYLLAVVVVITGLQMMKDRFG